MTLRPYQATAVESALRALATSGSAVLQMPTGAGKTKAATAIIERADKPVWFICHRQEIERQAAAAFSKAGIDFGIVSPRATREYDKPVQIVSVATLARRIADLPLPALVIWDECHHVAAKSWAKIREALGDSQHLGLTATPERLDGKGLSEWFNELIVGPSTRELIDDGWLSDFRYFAPSEPDLTGARLQAGDYVKKDLAKAMNTPVLIGDAIAEYQKNAAGKRALVFAASVEASKALVERFNAEGIHAAHVDGTTPTEARDAAVSALASGGIKVLSNVEVFTEGFDLPAIDAVILLRPTKSLALFLQMIGRALRKAEGKDEALIFDHAGLWLDHDWFDQPISWSLEGGARERRLAGRTVGPRRCPECKEVRPARIEVCACGYEFPTGREIGEYDGVLRELRGAVPDIPDGCVTREHFARLIRATSGVVRRAIASGLPTKDAFVVRDAGLAWMEDAWHPRNFPPRNVRRPEDYISQTKFGEAFGISPGRIPTLVDMGLPAATNGWIHTKLGEVWLNNNNDLAFPQSRPEDSPFPPDGFLMAHEFMKEKGIGASTMSKLYKRGLEFETKNVGGHKAVSKADAELALDAFYKSLGPQRPPNGFLSGVSFCSLFSSSKKQAGKKFTALRRKGLPYDEQKGIHIQRGLEWVRDNTNIKIPPEAWPTTSQHSANDNDSGTTTKRAA